MDATTAQRAVRREHRRAPGPMPRTALDGAHSGAFPPPIVWTDTEAGPVDGARLSVVELPATVEPARTEPPGVVVSPRSIAHAAGPDGWPVCGRARGRLVPTMLAWNDGDPGQPWLCPRCRVIAPPTHVWCPPLPTLLCPPPPTDAVRWWLAGNQRAEGWSRLFFPGMVYLWFVGGMIGRLTGVGFTPPRFACSVAGIAAATALLTWSSRKWIGTRVEVSEDGLTVVDDRGRRRWAWSEICQFESAGRPAGLAMRARANEVVSLQLGVEVGASARARALNQAFGLPRDARFMAKGRR